MSDTNEHQTDEFEAPEAEAPEVDAVDTAQTETDERGPPQRVPLAVLMQEREALKQEREARKIDRAEIQRLHQQFEVGNSRLEELMQTVQRSVQPPRPSETIPDVDTDPVGHFKAKSAAQERELAEIKQWKQQSEQQGQQLSGQQRLVAAYQADANAYKEKAPDWDNAYEHFKKTVFEMAVEAGATQEQAMQEMLVQEQRIVTTALHNRKSPAEVVFNTAKRWGYKAAAPANDGTARMDAMQRGQVAAKSTSGGGSGAERTVTVEQLAAMTPEQFARVPMHLVDRAMGKGT